MLLHARHAGHDHDKSNNVKTGYIILVCTFLAMCLVSIKNSVARRVPHKYRRLVNPPLWVTVVAWTAFIVVFSLSYLRPDGFVGISKRAGR
jgi:uncharacterized protein (DUF983 family)